MTRPKKQPNMPFLTAEDIYGSREEMPMPEPKGRGIESVMPGTSRVRSSKIKLETAKAAFEALGKTNPKAYKKDKCTKSKKLLKTPTVSWVKNMGSADVPSIDAPGKCTTKVIGGEQVTVCTVPKNAKFDKICKPASKKGKGKGTSRAKASADDKCEWVWDAKLKKFVWVCKMK